MECDEGGLVGCIVGCACATWTAHGAQVSTCHEVRICESRPVKFDIQCAQVPGHTLATGDVHVHVMDVNSQF